MDAKSLQNAQISRSMRLICTWSAIPMVVLLFGGLTISGFITPVAPSNSAAEVAAEYRDHNDRIRAGLAISFVSIIFLVLFGAAIAAQTRKIESVPPVLSYASIAGYASGTLVFVIPWVCWETAAYRTGRSDSEIALLNDLGWMMFVFSYVAFTAWLVAIGLCILNDTGVQPMYPRWLGYYNFFVAVSFIPDNLIPFFKTGPFAWNGLFPYYFPFVMYGLWILIMTVYTHKAIKREEAEELAAQAAPTAAESTSDPGRVTAG